MQFHEGKLFLFLTVASEAILSSQEGVSSQLALTYKVDTHGEP